MNQNLVNERTIFSIGRAALFAAVAILSAVVASAATTNFATGFEGNQGYASPAPLAGQLDWISYSRSTNNVSYVTNIAVNGNGVDSPGLGGSAQAAFMGLTPLTAPYNKSLELLQFLRLDPIGSNQPIVTFTTKVKITDSNNGFYDGFSFDFYNKDGLLMFGVELDNFDFMIYRVNSSGLGVSTGVTFTDGVEYPLSITMNFASNSYTAIFNGVTIVPNQPIAGVGIVLNLWSVGAVWLPDVPSTPGNNFMTFDDWRIVSSSTVPSPPQLRVITPGGVGAATIRLTGTDGFKFAVDASTNLAAWLPVNTNTVIGGSSDYLDSAATGKAARYYRGRWVP